jgi:hypothetical protein
MLMVVFPRILICEFVIEVYVRLMSAIGGSEISMLSGRRIACGGVSSRLVEAVRRVGMSVAGSIGTVMIDLGDFQVVLGGKGRWCHPNGNSKVLRDCPNHNLSWI